MSAKKLLAFDFDHTIVDDNTDIVVLKMLNSEKASTIRELYKKQKLGWTSFMNLVFFELHNEGKTKEDISTVLRSMPLTNGMKELLNCLKSFSSSYDCVIISDSNHFFIETILNHYGLKDIFQKVYTNSSSFNTEGKLMIEPCHSHNHETCPSNMCKTTLLREFQQVKENLGTSYEHIYYIGDGGNDFCPLTSLSHKDIGFVRVGYALEKLLKHQDKKSLVVAPIVLWSSASEIGQKVFSKCSAGKGDLP